MGGKHHGFGGSSHTPEPRHRLYSIWAGMKDRCNRPGHIAYHRYGGAGINVCDRWNDFKNFKDDLFESYEEHVAIHGEKDTTIDRLDNTKGYSPGNCKWSTDAEQRANKSKPKTSVQFEAEYTVPGPSFGYKEISESIRTFAVKYGLGRTGISQCLKGNWSQYKGWKFNVI